MRTKLISCRVYLEGQEVLFNAIQLSEIRGRPPIANISFPADSHALHLLPKTVCHIFWLDDGDGEGTEGGAYKLIFIGELSGHSIMFDNAKRDIQLQFNGLTQNWLNSYVIPLDISLETIQKHLLMCIDFPKTDPEKGGTSSDWRQYDYTFNPQTGTGFTPFELLVNRLTDDKQNLGLTLVDMIKAFSDQTIYLKMISNAHNIYGMIHGYDSLSIRGTMKIQSVAAMLGAIGNQVRGTNTLHETLQQVMDMMGYEFCELSAPSVVDNQLKKIFLRPKCDFFTPVKCNVVFDDDIQHLQFNRDIDREPTRLINTTYPFFMAEDSGLLQVAISTIVPHNVVLGNAIKEKMENNNILGLTEEEQCRGVVVATRQDMSGLENSYIMQAMKKIGVEGKNVAEVADKLKQEQNKKVTAAFKSEIYGPTQDEEVTKLHEYHMRMAQIDFADQRHAARVCSVSTPYNPYRLIGCPGMILTKYFSALVGTLDRIDNYISADGTAIQNLNFSHVRVYHLPKPKTVAGPTTAELNNFTLEPTADFGFMDDSFADAPEWYKDFTPGTKLETFYRSMTGMSHAAVFNGTDNRTFGNAASELYSTFETQSNGYKWVNDYTKRELPTLAQYKNYVPEQAERSLSHATVTGLAVGMFVSARIHRVKDVFDYIGSSLSNKLYSKKG